MDEIDKYTLLWIKETSATIDYYLQKNNQQNDIANGWIMLCEHILQQTVYQYMWCDLGESVRCWTCDIFSFLFDWSCHLERYILLKTSLELVQWFQGYEQLKIPRTIENNWNAFLFLAICHHQSRAINTADFGLIPLDRNTYVKSSNLCDLNGIIKTSNLIFSVMLFWHWSILSTMLFKKKKSYKIIGSANCQSN